MHLPTLKYLPWGKCVWERWKGRTDQAQSVPSGSFLSVVVVDWRWLPLGNQKKLAAESLRDKMIQTFRLLNLGALSF